jgi:glutathione synthase/RimK-type ligase-like ATP-grasp enzyme
MHYLLRKRKLGKTSCKFISLFSKHGIKTFCNDQKLPEEGTCIRWGCTSNIPTNNVINTANAIHLVNDKLAFRKILQEAKLCPETTFSISLDDMDSVGFPCIVRPANHAQGKHVYFCNDFYTLANSWNKVNRNGYISKFIDKESEYRVFIGSGRVLCVAKKTPGNPKDIAWNVAQGGRFDNVRWDDWPLKAIKKSIEAFNLSELDFGGVDVMVDKEEDCTILEINSAPSLTSEYRQKCFAKYFDYIIEHGKKHIDVIRDRGGYAKFIHPAISEKALIP